MKSIRMSKIIYVALALFFALGVQPKITAQMVSPDKTQVALPVALSIDAFEAERGWVFSADLSKAEGLPDLDGCPTSQAGGAAFSAASFDPDTFDPRLYAIPQAPAADAMRPLDFRIADRGVIQFHSAARLEVLYARYLANLKNEK